MLAENYIIEQEQRFFAVRKTACTEWQQTGGSVKFSSPGWVVPRGSIVGTMVLEANGKSNQKMRSPGISLERGRLYSYNENATNRPDGRKGG